MTVSRRPFVKRLMLHVALLPFLIFALFPFYHMTLTSLKQDRELYDRYAVPLVITQGPTLEHYAKLLWDTEFLTWTKNSLIVTFLATGISVVVGTITAYALARLKFFGVASLGVTTELIRGDIYFWGSLMAGAVLGSVPIVILYVFFLDYYVSGLTAGAIK